MTRFQRLMMFLLFNSWEQQSAGHQPDKIITCGTCRGKGERDGNDCDYCGGNGARYRCDQRDCAEFGCSFDFCYVPDDVARENGFPL